MYITPLLILASITASPIDYYAEGRKHVQDLMLKHQENEEQRLELKKQITSLKLENPVRFQPSPQSSRRQCQVNTKTPQDSETNLYVFVSFNMPDESWITLSREVAKVGGIAVLRGLPENSFKELAFKMHHLRQLGVSVTVQVDPRLFTKYAVEQVPSFVVINGDDFDKLSGNVSLSFALEKIGSSKSKALRGML